MVAEERKKEKLFGGTLQREYFLRHNILRGRWANVVLSSEQISLLLPHSATELDLQFDSSRTHSVEVKVKLTRGVQVSCHAHL